MTDINGQLQTKTSPDAKSSVIANSIEILSDMSPKAHRMESVNQGMQTGPDAITEMSRNDNGEHIEDEGDGGEDVLASLAGFTSAAFEVLGSSYDSPLTLEERAPRALSPSGCDATQTLRLLQDLLMYDEEDPGVAFGLGYLDANGRLAVTSHLLAAAVTTLDATHLRRLATRVMSDCSVWISRLFRYFDATAYCHEDIKEGLVKVCRMLLHTRYPRYAADGFEALYARPPVIYVNSTIRPGLAQHVAAMLGLGSGCIRVVPCNTIVGSPVAMDTAALDRMMGEDVAAQRKPLIVIANAGGGTLSGVDNLNRIQELCHTHEAWLHVEGHVLAALTLPNMPNLPAKVADSMTLPLSMWLGIPSLPYVTLYRASEMTAVRAASFTTLTLEVRLSCLPLWTCLQTLGQGGVVSHIQHAFELSQRLQVQLLKLPMIKLLSPIAMSVPTPVKDLINKPISTSQLLETACPTVVFQYVEGDKARGKNSEYYDNLNSWLGQVVRRDVVTIPLELIHLEADGLVLRWCPLEGPETGGVTAEDVDTMVASLAHQMEILDATVKQRRTFMDLVASEPNLKLVQIPGWAGLGGVRYVPDLWGGETGGDGAVPDMARAEVDHLNAHLVAQLKATDSAFSLGEGIDSMHCVRFGMITSDTDLTELLSLVVKTGKEIETSSKFLEQMTDIVRKGITAATEDLKRENEERLWQDGLLRHVPIVGSVYNWFSPPPPAGIKGRTLDLTAGVLESTENIYRYHMQIRHGAPSTKGETRLPPSSVITPVTPTPSTPSHSRTSSAAPSPSPPDAAHSRHTSETKPLTAVITLPTSAEREPITA